MVCQPDGDGSTDRGGVLAVAAGGAGAAAGPGTPGDADAPRAVGAPAAFSLELASKAASTRKSENVRQDMGFS